MTNMTTLKKHIIKAQSQMNPPGTHDVHELLHTHNEASKPCSI